MNCVICAAPIVHAAPTKQRVKEPGKRAKIVTTYDPQYLSQTPYCPAPATCGDQWRNRQPFLFNVARDTFVPPEHHAVAALSLVLARQGIDDSTLARISQVSKPLRTFGMASQVAASRAPAQHFDKGNDVGFDITADQMLDIAILAYHGALELKRSGKPVILYRVADKRALNDDEKLQTLSGRIRIKIPGGTDAKEVWPLEKTAAWIQGALRARSRFVLLTDPRTPDILVGGKDNASDAVYVREIHQILSTGYEIKRALDTERTAALIQKNVHPFVLQPRAGEVGVPMPLVPRMSRHMAATKAWDGNVTSLTIGDPAELIRDELVRKFTAAGIAENVAPY